MVNLAQGWVNGQKTNIELAPIGAAHFLEKSAARDYALLEAAAKAAGHILHVNTSFRSWTHQERLYKDWMAWLALPAADRRIARKPPRASKPGYSTHQSGRSVDINRAAGDDPRTREYDSPVDLWLKAHAHRYNFVSDVPDEAWHWTHDPELAAKMAMVI